MVRSLLTAVMALVVPRRVPIFELAGAAAVTAGVVIRYGWWLGLVVIGVALLGKSLEWDTKAGSG